MPGLRLARPRTGLSAGTWRVIYRETSAGKDLAPRSGNLKWPAECRPRGTIRPAPGFSHPLKYLKMLKFCIATLCKVIYSAEKSLSTGTDSENRPAGIDS